MPRYHVKNKENKWNLFSTVVDGYLYDNFVSFEEHKERCILDDLNEYLKERYNDLNSLNTEKPKINVMNYEEAERRKRVREEYERKI